MPHNTIHPLSRFVLRVLSYFSSVSKASNPERIHYFGRGEYGTVGSHLGFAALIACLIRGADVTEKRFLFYLFIYFIMS